MRRALSSGARDGVEPKLGRVGRLVGVIDARELGEFAAARLRVQALRIARLADGERCVHVDLHDALGADERPRFAPGHGLAAASTDSRPS